MIVAKFWKRAAVVFTAVLLALPQNVALARGGHGGGGGGHGGGGHHGGGGFGGGHHGGGFHGGGHSFSHGGGISRGGGGFSHSSRPSFSHGSSPSMRGLSSSGLGHNGGFSGHSGRSFSNSHIGSSQLGRSSGAGGFSSNNFGHSLNSGHRNFADRNFASRTGGTHHFQANRPNFSSNSHVGLGGHRSDFVSRNFHNASSRNHGALGGAPGAHGWGGSWNQGAWNHGGWNHGKGNWNNNWNHGNWNNWGHNHRWNNWNNNWWGGNRGWYGYGRRSWGYPGWNSWGWGWGYPFLGWNLGGWGLYGLGWGLGYGGWGGYGYGGGYYPTYYDTYVYPNTTYYADSNTVAPAVQQPADQLAATGDFIADGEAAFRIGRYADAVKLWQHAMVDDPNNGAVVLLMAQALFAQGQYEAAANTTQMAMQMLPETEWGNVVKNYTQLYGNIEDYTNQIRAAEKARDEHPDDGAVRFLLGYHFGYLNYPKQAVRELDAALKIEPRDVGAEKLRDIFAVQAGIPARPHTAEPAAGQPAGIAPGPAAGPQLGPDQKPALPPPSVGTDA